MTDPKPLEAIEQLDTAAHDRIVLLRSNLDRLFIAARSNVIDAVQVAEAQIVAGYIEIERLLQHSRQQTTEAERMRELLIRADSLLSLLWHRHVPADRKDLDLRLDVERTIADLRKAQAVKP